MMLRSFLIPRYLSFYVRADLWGRRYCHTTEDSSNEYSSEVTLESNLAEEKKTERVIGLKKLVDSNISPYPHFFLSKSHRTIHEVERYLQEPHGSTLYNDTSFVEDKVIEVSGRISSLREFGQRLVFIDILREGRKLQIVASMKDYIEEEDYQLKMNVLRPGDIIRVSGKMGKTKTGTISVFANHIDLLSPCFHRIPSIDNLKNPQVRHRRRYLDMIVNPSVLRRLTLRSKIIQYIRSYLDNKGFLEVETPILSTFVGGAAARPFATYLHNMHMELQMRISPELYLKQLIIGGMDKVYEIGKQFRNEGLDATHNPEFTTCELYQAYSNYEDLFSFTEEMLSNMMIELFGTVKFSTYRNGRVEMDFTPPFKRISIVPYLETILNRKLPDFGQLETDHSQELIEIFKEKNISLPSILTVPKLLDHLIAYYIESECNQPTFLCDHPLVMSPLAKQHPTQPGLSARFELFANQSELVNAYSELNDPFEQKKRFLLQQEYRRKGDLATEMMNSEFCTALEYGLPPTAGWGLGIDRLCMMLSASPSIKEVISFPLTRSRTQRSKIESMTNDSFDESLPSNSSMDSSIETNYPSTPLTQTPIQTLANDIYVSNTSNNLQSFEDSVKEPTTPQSTHTTDI